MTTDAGNRSTRLFIDIESELQQEIEAAAREKDMSVRDYVVAVLRQALSGDGADVTVAESRSWAELSARSFARDWASDADRVYDELP